MIRELVHIGEDNSSSSLFTNDVIRRRSASGGIISTLAGGGVIATLGPDVSTSVGNLYIAGAGNSIRKDGAGRERSQR